MIRRMLIAASCFVVVLSSARLLANPVEEFKRLEDEMEAAFDSYVEALEARSEKGDAAAEVPDGRPAVIKKMDALVAANVGKPEGAELAAKTFIWSAMFTIDPAKTYDRFALMVKHYPDHESAGEIAEIVPDVYESSGDPKKWVSGLEAIGAAAKSKGTKQAASFSAARLLMAQGELDNAKKAYERAREADPASETGLLAKGFVYEIEHLQIGMEAPDFSTTTVDGKKVSLKDLRGKVVLLDFWATWCGPCLGEIPHLKDAVKHFSGKPFEILGVSLDDFEEMLTATIEHNKLPGVHTWEEAGRENAVATLYNAQVLPTWYLIDDKGVIRARDTFGDALIPAVEKLLSKK